MTFDPRDKTLKISTEDLSSGGRDLLSAIHYFRKSAGLPLEGGKNDSSKDTCEYCILKAAKHIGIDLGATRPGELDVRKYS